MQLIVPVWKIGLADEAAVRGRPRVEVDDAERVAPAVAADIEQRDVGEPFGWRLHRHAR
jgi:hypothetical protein